VYGTPLELSFARLDAKRNNGSLFSVAAQNAACAASGGLSMCFSSRVSATCLVGLAMGFGPGTVRGQVLPVATCDATAPPPFCSAVRGERASGWQPQSRSEVMARNGMVATSQPLAAQAGLRVLQQGGNAIDAAVTAAAVLSVTEPMSVGVASDLFAVIYIAKENKTYVLNASGTAPSGATLEHFNALGYRANPKNWGPGSGMPLRGIATVTVPGTVWGWEEALKRFGTRTFKEVLEPAVAYAEEGFPVSERIANDWTLPYALPLRECCTQLDSDSVKTWYIDGKPPRPGQVFRNPDLARTFRLLEAGGRDAFYKGSPAKAIVAKSNALGGTMTLADLAGYRGEWMDAATGNYHGYEVLELPPPSQAWAAIEMLKILEVCVPAWTPGQTLASLGPTSPKYWHLLVEAKKLAYADLLTYNADPNFSTVPVARLLSSEHAATLCGKVDPNRALSKGQAGKASGDGDTIVLSAADRWGNMVSWVNSNYLSFGSGITVPGTGFVLHNRGSLFSLDARSPNAIAPHKRPFNTLSAGFVMHAGRPLMTITLMGGDMQAQGHAQALINLLDLGANMQAASDMARFRHNQITNELSMETPLFNLVGAQLRVMGHDVKSVNGSAVGGFQSISFSPEEGKPPEEGHRAGTPQVDGVYRGGSDHRKDGEAVGW
jgi:gamma-glutamyltranspeptidase/glutathione hydrolase